MKELHCPLCDTVLIFHKEEAIGLYACPKCQGFFIHTSKLSGYIDKVMDKTDIKVKQVLRLEPRKVKIVHSLIEKLHICPRCLTTMEKYNYVYDSNVFLDRCSKCNFIWVDKGELEGLVRYRKFVISTEDIAKSIDQELREKAQMKEIAETSRHVVGLLPLGLVLGIRLFPYSDSTDNPRTIFPGVTVSIISINVIILILSFFRPDRLFYSWGMIPNSLLNGLRPYTVITSMFLQGSIFHLFGNMFFLWIFGDNVEEKLGHIKFILFYILFGVVASLVHVAINPQSSLPTVGASGAISGIMGAYFVMFPNVRINCLFGVGIYFRKVKIKAFWFLLFWMAMQLLSYIFFRRMSNIAFGAHISGFGIGALIAYLIGGNKWRKKIQEVND